MESTEPADKTVHAVRNVGTEQFICIKQENIDIDYSSAAEHEIQPEAFAHRKQTCTLLGSTSPSQVTHCIRARSQKTLQTHLSVKDEPAIEHQEQISQGLGPRQTFRSAGDIQPNTTQTDSITIKTEPQGSTENPLSDKDVADKPTQCHVGLNQNVHTTDCMSESETSMNGQLGGETSSTVPGAGRLDSGDCKSPFGCKQCGSAFTTSLLLKQHRKTHACDRACGGYECKQCGAAYGRLDTLKCHMKTHSAEKPYVCKQCKAEFDWPCRLKRHMMTHTGEKPHVCKQCGATFTRSSSLNQHMIIHSGEKSHVCQHCGAAFNSPSTLRYHIRIHTGEKPYVCEQCGAAFTKSSNLKQHMKIHTHQKPHVRKNTS